MTFMFKNGLIKEEVQDDLLSRGYSRRQMMRTAMMFAGGAAALTMSGESARAADDEAGSGMVRIGLNECWAGPMEPGLKAGTAALAQSNRYSPNGEIEILTKTISTLDNVPVDHVSVYPGSGGILSRAIVAYCSPTKGMVMADPSYNNVVRTANFIKSPVSLVALTSDYRHDVKAMLAANPNAGLYYVVNPNNPTGTMTPMAEIEWLVENKPAGAIVLIDEAYIHWTNEYPNNTALHLVRAGKEVIIARTFSKIFGMAGARCGYLVAQPDVLKKIALFESDRPSMATAACANASLTATSLMAARRKELFANRAMTADYLTKRGLRVIGPSYGNMIMVDWKTKTAKEMIAIYKAANVQIAADRWPVWPTVGRISIGSKKEMDAFIAASGKILT
ncbi:MAG: aminotransferase class I/II-fold pyridoxal phosphate-dependent enzyme [Alphaproteobacteria bacterium]|nr:aminotransferase class I/II-fold pyridoxal phosphate-dependent enzyme [Alphaproteobacteria bacterium]